MPSHPNRGRPGPGSNLKPAQVRQLREAAGLTVADAASMVHASVTAWLRFEAPEDSPEHGRMHPGLWKLFQIMLVAREHPATWAPMEALLASRAGGASPQ